MKKTVVVFGLISGAVSALMMMVTVPFEHKIPYDKALIIGYTTLVLSFLLVFFGVRSYRDNVGNGVITFGKAFAVGICITLISCACYVGTWEVIYFRFMPDFLDKYNAQALARFRASGASAEAVQMKIQELAKSKEMYNNVFYNMALTFLEPFPVGLVVTLISAAALRRKTPRRADAGAAV